MTAASPAAARPSRATIVSPVVDTLAVGGLSLLAFIPLLLTGRTDLVMISTGAQATIAALINMPHFLASYRMIYRSRDMVFRHQWASIWIPLILILYILVAIYQSQYTPTLVTMLLVVSSGYLAWHYTGQAWGMMATYAYLEGSPFQDDERLLVRGGLRILLAWHVVWFFHSSGFAAEVGFPLDSVYTGMTWLTLVALGLGVVGLTRMRRRTGKLPPARALVAWAAIFVWYAAMARDPRAIFWVQIAHALQYLIFPVRVELNVTERQDPVPSHVWRHMVLYGTILLGISWVMSYQFPSGAMQMIARALGERPGELTPVVIFAFLNIHHYFTDGVIWKLRNPEVRRDLFAHVGGVKP